MLIVERQQRVLELLERHRTMQLEDLARDLDVSGSTIRRDLIELESRGLIERTRAGAIYKDQEGQEGQEGRKGQSRSAAGEPAIDLSHRMNEQAAQKQAIGRAAAALVRPHMTVLMDGGSTVIHAARLIESRPIQIVTNSLLIASHFIEDERVEILMIGGSLYPRTGITLGPIATGCLADLHADLLLFSLSGIYEQQAYNINLPMAQVEQSMMQQAARSVLLMDATKFGRKSLVQVCRLDEIDEIISDDRLDLSWREQLGERLSIAKSMTD